MSFDPNQARDKTGKWAGGAEAQVRNSGRAPVAMHVEPSVNTHVSNLPIGAQVGKGIRDLIGASASTMKDAKGHGSGDYTKDTRTGKSPTSGYQVAGSGGRFTGQWTDPATGKVYRERSHNVDSLALAKSMGRRANQIAIYDVKNRRDVRTGGTGKVQS